MSLTARLDDVAAHLRDHELRLTAHQSTAEQLSGEREALVDQLRTAAGLGGRKRHPGASSERARIAVRKAIATALTQIDRHAPDVARLLRDAVHTGVTCRYDPDPDRPVTWITD